METVMSKHTHTVNVPSNGQIPPLRTLEGQRDAFRRFFMLVAIVFMALAIGMAIKWAYTVYYVDTHCTTVLGTRVCQ
jgi:hypothetical protein